MFKKRRFRPQRVVERNTTSALRRTKRGSLRFHSCGEPRCQTLKSRVLSVITPLHFRSANRSTTGNATLLIQNAANHAVKQGEPTSAAQEDLEVNVNDSRLPATNAARLILFHSSLPQGDQFCAAIVSARVVRSNELNASATPSER